MSNGNLGGNVSSLLGHGTAQVQIGKAPRPNTRRPREPITLSEEEERTMTDDQKKKKKSALSQARTRERKKQRVKDLEDMVRELWKRVQYLETTIQTLHPNEALENALYANYTPLAISQNLEPITEPNPGEDRHALAVDWSELAWLFDPSKSDDDDDEPM